MLTQAILRFATPARLRAAILGVTLLGLLLLGGLGIYLIVNQWQRITPAVGLSAVFDSHGQLNIKGQVQAKGATVEGQAQITVEKLPVGERQTVIAPVRDGQFNLTADTAFSSFRTNDLVRVKVKVWSNQHRTPASEEVVLNGQPPLIPRAITSWLLVGIFLLLLTTFLWAFTGKHMPGKNRVAIILSYCIILICLGVPLLSPIIIPRVFPDLLKSLRDTPVGLVVAVDPRFQSRPEADVLKHPQWMLNIGGYVSTNLNMFQTNSATNREVSLPADVVTVWGGLVVPLYVVILSIIGGAINMTMKLPMSQRDQESEINLNLKGFTRAIGEFVLKIRTPPEELRQPPVPDNGPTGQKPEPTGTVASAAQPPPQKPSAPAQGKSPPRDGPDGKPDQSGEQRAEDTAAGNAEPGERLRRWRKDLLEQYMFLISAPFLGIVTYYLLIWLDLVKVPVLVLVSFSIGLITQRILDTIIGFAENVVTRDKSVQVETHPDPSNGAGNARNGATVRTRVPVAATGAAGSTATRKRG